MTEGRSRVALAFSVVKGKGEEKQMEQGKYVPLVRMMMVREKNIPYMAESVSTPEKAAELARKILAGADREYCLVLSMDNQQKPLAMEIISIGTVDMAPVNPREVFKHAILANASNIIIIHNHTSGECTPSVPDVELTERLIEAGKILGIPVADHIIVGDRYFSFAEKEMLNLKY